MGTLRYMSPEQVSRRRVDARADVYPLAVTLYEVLTLELPFEGDTEHRIQDPILFEEPVPPRKRNPRLHRDLETILLHALEKNPERRYDSATDFAADLRRFLRYEPIKARPQSAMTRLARRAARHRAAIVAMSTVLVSLVIVGALIISNQREARLRREETYEPTVLNAVMKMERHRLGRIDYSSDCQGTGAASRG